ncbi:MAG: protein of unknown function (DUF4395) [Candidatus Electronema aureum]|uniref:DUF4395 domain-containing protein n=1 Tax=Candidatus Electronema aureum TaxID=2005002 RepID=A0A521G5R4_9BACT|nr:MAG: protein of unknown function (DUF4395) [Candidatus Electronema aureum]
MNAMCPVSFEKIDENVARLNAVQTVILLLFFLFSPPLQWLILIVAADFCVRAFWQPKYSLFAMISRKIIALLKIKPVMVDVAPKIFAARIGFLFSCLLIACWLLHLNAAALIVGLMFAVCALLEAAFRFCVACKMYPLVCKITDSH